MTCSRSSSPIVNATVSAMAPLWAQGGHFYFGETGHLHLGPTIQRLISTGYVNLGLCGDYAQCLTQPAATKPVASSWHATGIAGLENSMTPSSTFPYLSIMRSSA